MRFFRTCKRIQILESIMGTSAGRRGPLLVVEDVHAAYFKKEILRGVSFSVERGEIVAVLGGNGSGKSTLLKTIVGLLRQSRGKIILEGMDISSVAVRSRQQMGIVHLLQGGQIFPNLTVGENFGIAVTHSPECRGGRPALGDVFSELKTLKVDRAGLLSGGQRQMLAIEMVLAQRPRLALFDEPTGSLSTSNVGGMLEAIASFSRDFGCSMLLVEQNVAEAQRVAKRCLRLEDGVAVVSS